MFDAGWTGVGFPPRDSPARLGLSGVAAKSLQVVEQLALAFAVGEITAALLLSLPARIGTDDDLAALDDDDTHRHYPLRPSAWDEYWPSHVTDWPSSQIRVNVRDVLVSDDKPHRSGSRLLGSLQEVRRDLSYRADQMLEAPVVVLRADHALRALLPLKPIPECPSTNMLSRMNRL